MQSESFNPFEVESERAYVVYDPRSGEIRHEHIVTNFKGGSALTPEKEKAQALELAQRFGHSAGELKVLSVDPKQLDGRSPLRVDLETSKLVEDRSKEKDASS